MDEQKKDVRKNASKDEIKAAKKPHNEKADLLEKPEKRILDTGSELKRALDAWNDLAAQAPTPSADEKLLHDVQDLLKQLKTQIEQFK